MSIDKNSNETKSSKIKLIANFKARSYQQSIFANSLNKNTLVILPTGLGKTVVAIMLSVFYFNQTGKKILFLAPTRPLVEQQEKSFQSFFQNSKDFNFQTLTGQVSPAKRVEMYKTNHFIFSTPQLIENDIVNRIIKPSDFALVIFDEAHRGTGNYAYGFIAEQFNLSYDCKILALTASPGATLETVREVADNLRIEHIEVKKYEDYDVKPYVKETTIENIKVQLNDDFREIKNNLETAFYRRIQALQDMGFLTKKNAKQITKTDLLMLQKDLRLMISDGEADDDTWKAISLGAGLMKLQYGIELFESQEISAAYAYFHNFFRAGGDKSKAVQELIIDNYFRDAFSKLVDMKKKEIQHPKLIKLKEIVADEIAKTPELRIIIFNQYRDTATKLVEELSKIKGIKPALFVGQSKKGDFKLSQKDQKKILEDFREGVYNIIVSTSVGEEGLDIPKVDLVIFYEPVPSAIRTIQRIGRTGRFKKGKAYILITEGTRDVVVSFIAGAKERKMYKVLDQLKKEYSESSTKENEGLNKFIKPKENTTNNNNTNNTNNTDINNSNSQKNTDERFESEEDKKKIDGVSDLPKIYVDNRENTDLIKELFHLTEIEVQAKKLDVADIVITEQIAIERKAKKDFVNSIIDKRLFPQLIDLAKNYRRPILMIEGKESLFAIRNINPNVIRATLSAIAVNLRIPIIYTDSMKESAQMIQTITKRTLKKKKEVSLVAEKSASSENEELEKFVSMIPKVNIMTAKILLNNFTSVKKLVGATEKRLIKCDGIGPARAKFLVNFFKREYE